MSEEWNPVGMAPDRRVLMTKIDDGNGVRNESALYRSGAMWWVPDGSMYVYYFPTHWRELTATERDGVDRAIRNKMSADKAEAERALARLK